MSEKRTASFKPSTMIAGGLFDDGDATIKQARFKAWDYQGKIPAPVLALELVLQPDEGDEIAQYFSAGDLKNWTPSEDGKRLVAIGTQTGLNNNSNFAQFVASLVNSGFPEDKLDDDISVVEGTSAHWNRVAQPKRSGLVKREGEREATVLVVTQIHKLPWDKKGGGPAKAGSGGAKPSVKSKSTPSQEELDEKAAGVVFQILAAAEGGKVTRAKLSGFVFKEAAQDPDRNALVTRAYQEEFLSGEDRPWDYKDGILSLKD